jgi:glyoxylase-like metal-dependent hydrolase (beta-lactamase superfamily II)
MIVVTSSSVVVVDCPGGWVKDAIDFVSGGKTVSHYIYSHSHSDHNANCGALFPSSTIYVSHEETAKQIKDANNSGRPVPTVTFDTNLTLSVGGIDFQLLTLDSPNHVIGNIIVYLPTFDTIMLVDVIYPGWAPFFRIGLAENLDTYLSIHDSLLSLPWTYLNAGHLGRLGTREDVQTNKDYFLSVKQHAADADIATRLYKVFSKRVAVSQGNFWFGIKSAFYKSARYCAKKVVEQWSTIIGGVDVMAVDHCFQIGEHYRIK